MKKLKKNTLFLVIIVFLVLLILFSNVGQSFKNDIFSYDNTYLHYRNINRISKKSKSHQEFMDIYSKYITSNMSYYKVVPLNKNGYFTEYDSNISDIEYTSSLEVFSSYGKLIKRYQYNTDFLEDFKGNIKSGIVKSKFIYADDFNTIANNPTETIIFNGYENKTNYQVTQIDNKLKLLGVSAVISPSYTNDLKYDSYINGEDLISSNRGLAKFIVRKDIFNELKYYSKLGYTIKIKNGANIQNIKFRNIYGKIDGKNSKYKPLVIVSYYDDEYKVSAYKNHNGGSISTSLILDCIRSIDFQRLNNSDRTIVFVFIPRVNNNNQLGFKYFSDNNTYGDTIVLNNIGIGNEYLLTSSKQNKLFCDSIQKILKKNKFDVVSNSINIDNNSTPLIVDCSNNNYRNDFSLDTLGRSSKLFLSIIENECYNLDFLSGNIRQIRIIKKYINDYSVSISIFTLLLVLIFIFKYSLYQKGNSK